MFVQRYQLLARAMISFRLSVVNVKYLILRRSNLEERVVQKNRVKLSSFGAFHWMAWTAAIWHKSITDKMQIYRVHELYMTLSRFLRGDMYYTNEGILSLISRILINVRFLSYRHLANNHPPSWKHKFLVTALPWQGFYGLAAGE